MNNESQNKIIIYFNLLMKFYFTFDQAFDLPEFKKYYLSIIFDFNNVLTKKNNFIVKLIQLSHLESRI